MLYWVQSFTHHSGDGVWLLFCLARFGTLFHVVPHSTLLHLLGKLEGTLEMKGRLHANQRGLSTLSPHLSWCRNASRGWCFFSIAYFVLRHHLQKLDESHFFYAVFLFPFHASRFGDSRVGMAYHPFLGAVRQGLARRLSSAAFFRSFFTFFCFLPLYQRLQRVTLYLCPICKNFSSYRPPFLAEKVPTQSFFPVLSFQLFSFFSFSASFTSFDILRYLLMSELIYIFWCLRIIHTGFFSFRVCLVWDGLSPIAITLGLPPAGGPCQASFLMR